MEARAFRAAALDREERARKSASLDETADQVLQVGRTRREVRERRRRVAFDNWRWIAEAAAAKRRKLRCCTLCAEGGNLLVLGSLRSMIWYMAATRSAGLGYREYCTGQRAGETGGSV